MVGVVTELRLHAPNMHDSAPMVMRSYHSSPTTEHAGQPAAISARLVCSLLATDAAEAAEAANISSTLVFTYGGGELVDAELSLGYLRRIHDRKLAVPRVKVSQETADAEHKQEPLLSHAPLPVPEAVAGVWKRLVESSPLMQVFANLKEGNQSRTSLFTASDYRAQFGRRAYGGLAFALPEQPLADLRAIVQDGLAAPVTACERCYAVVHRAGVSIAMNPWPGARF